MRVLLLAGALALGSCAEAGLYLEAGTEAAKQAKDIEAKAIVSANCLVGVGALGRMENREHIAPVLDICFPTWRELK